jgi:DNA-binding IclR family transcriptional regulator
MPCLRLTPEQAQRLFGLPADVTARVIDTLIREGYVRQDADGRYVADRMT